MMSELSRELAAAALSDRTYADSHGPDFVAMKRSLRGVCGKELTMAETDDRVPICLLQHRNPRADLQELLMAEGVLTCSGGEFEPLDRSSVRLRVPRAEELDKLLRAVEKSITDEMRSPPAATMPPGVVFVGWSFVDGYRRSRPPL